jgi:hypothetical protein
MIRISFGNTDRADDEMIDFDKITSTGNAEPTSRVLDGSQDHGYAEEWSEPGILPDGRTGQIMYLFDDDDITDGDGNPLEEAEDYPWDEEHVRRFVLND